MYNKEHDRESGTFPLMGQEREMEQFTEARNSGQKATLNSEREEETKQCSLGNKGLSVQLFGLV